MRKMQGKGNTTEKKEQQRKNRYKKKATELLWREIIDKSRK